jgi:hypothetical protein
MEYANPNTLSDEHYERLGALTDTLDDYVKLHVRRYGAKIGLGDALNAVSAVLAAVVNDIAKTDPEVFDKLNGLIAYHIFLEAQSESVRGAYEIKRKVK